MMLVWRPRQRSTRHEDEEGYGFPLEYLLEDDDD
jgi:hypothetical protein